MTSTKDSWPELIGKDGEEAKKIILQERPDLEVHVMHMHAPATMDYRTDRVRICVDDSGKVATAPMTG